MKSLLHIVLIVFMAGLAFGQGWQTVKEGADVHFPNDGVFFDANTGLYVGKDGVVVKTSNGGQDGETLREPDLSGRSWRDVEFADVNIGFACADDGFIYKTEDGGVTWAMVADTANFTEDLKQISVVDANTVYVAGKKSMMLKSEDGGGTWTKSDFDFGEDLDGGIDFCSATVGVVATDANNGKTWYTHDGGTTWTQNIVTFPPATSSSRIYDVVAVGDSTIVLSGYHYCLFISKNGGKTFEQSGDYDFGYQRHVSVDAVDENIIVAAGSQGHAVKTLDGGASWTSIDVPSGQTAVFIDFIDADNGYVFSSYAQWFKTTDGGTSWTPLLEWPRISFWGLALTADNKIFATGWGGGELTSSTDGGQTWSYPSNEKTMSGGNIYECEFIDDNIGLMGGGSGYITRTADGGETWTFIDNPMYQGSNLHINAMHISSPDLIFAAGSKGNIIKSTDKGLTWTEVECEGTSTIYDLWTVSPTQVMASASSGQIYLSNATLDSFTTANDYGSMSMRAVEFRGEVGLIAASKGILYRTTVADWDTLTEVFTEPDGDDFYDVEFVTDLLVFVVGENGKIYKSEDAGLTWTAEVSGTVETMQKVRYGNNNVWAVGKNGTIIKQDLTPPTPVSGLVINEFMASNSSAFADENGEFDDWIEIYNSNDFPVDIGGLFVTDDLQEPAKWQIPATAPDTTTIPANGFLVLWADNDSEQGVLHVEIKLSGSGEQIGLVEDFLGDTLFVDSLTFSEQQTDTSYGYVNDGGGEWAQFNPASPGASNSGGTVVGISDRTDQVITEYHLNQNYPNPFNPTTTIEYSVKKAGQVSLVVYTVTGQKVATLINKKLAAGSGKITWDAKGVASGVYFYKLSSGDFTSVKKMLLVR